MLRVLHGDGSRARSDTPRAGAAVLGRCCIIPSYRMYLVYRRGLGTP